MNNNYIVFFDFDNTITRFDVIDDMLEKFSRDDKWIDLEKRWKAGKLGSRDCLKGQIKGIRISRKELNSYLGTIKLDPYFKKLLGLLRKNKIKTFILSDNFDFILNTILKHNGVKDLSIRSNRIRISGDRLIPSFPFSNNDCGDFCGHCKRSSLRRIAEKDKTLVYIGDGRSDICPAKSAGVVFAKDALLDYFRSSKLDHIPMKNLSVVYKYFKTLARLGVLSRAKSRGKRSLA
jgi:2-hydroxy-3-keto-5-methylthiopentenyl-1-phosphate phosphatase